MRFILTRDVREFARRSAALVSGRIELNVFATVLMNVLDGFYAEVEPLFALGVDEQDEVRFAALQTPPWPLLVSELEPSAAHEFVAALLDTGRELPGVNGLSATAQAIARAWAEQTGGRSRPRMRQALHVLTEVSDPPRPAAGRLRSPAAAEHPLLIAWMRGFIEETHIHGAGQVEQMIGTFLARDALHIWEDGKPVSMLVANPAVAGVVRVGMVYTPPELRRRGYAGTAVAAISRRVLETGAHTCTLFTDVANPTSNKIYAEVGYRRVAEWEEWEFTPPAVALGNTARARTRGDRTPARRRSRLR